MQDRNQATFAERFTAAAHLHIGNLQTLTIEQTDGEQIAGETEQATVWTAGCTLAHALAADLVPCAGKTVLELGSGCGLCGIVASLRGAAAVTLTDLPPLLPLLSRNAAANHAQCNVHALDWTVDNGVCPCGDWDLIIGSDITCFLQDNSALVRTIAKLAAPCDARVVLAHHDRGGDIADVLGAFETHFSHELVTERGNDGAAASSVSIHSFRLRQAGGDAVGDIDAVAAADSHGHADVDGLDDAVLEAAMRGDVRALKRAILSQQ